MCSYEVIAPQKEEAFERVIEQMHTRKHFPFLRGMQREYNAPEDKTLIGEPGMLSVVIPFYNLGKYLEDALKPFNNLKNMPFEIIVVDDGTNDHQSLEILKKLQESYQFSLERTQNRGLPDTRNTGAQLSRGEFLAFLDADDRMDPRFYHWAVKILNNYTNVSFVGCWMEYFGDTQGFQLAVREDHFSPGPFGGRSQRSLGLLVSLSHELLEDSQDPRRDSGGQQPDPRPIPDRQRRYG
jgi:cellulose synthase/poly-beta-1,6-N-acetylglucosamine synthase-like glycosyltransferase